LINGESKNVNTSRAICFSPQINFRNAKWAALSGLGSETHLKKRKKTIRSDGAQRKSKQTDLIMTSPVVQYLRDDEY